MKEMTKEEVLHVAHLARISVTDEDIEKYKVQLRDIMNMIDEINNVKIETKEEMISPTKKTNIFKEDIGVDEDVDVLSNAPKTNGNYIEIRRFVND